MGLISFSLARIESNKSITMNEHHLCIEDTVTGICSCTSLVILNENSKLYFNKVVSTVTVNSKNFKVNLLYNIAVILYVQCY